MRSDLLLTWTPSLAEDFFFALNCFRRNWWVLEEIEEIKEESFPMNKIPSWSKLLAEVVVMLIKFTL